MADDAKVSRAFAGDLMQCREHKGALAEALIIGSISFERWSGFGAEASSGGRHKGLLIGAEQPFAVASAAFRLCPKTDSLLR